METHPIDHVQFTSYTLSQISPDNLSPALISPSAPLSPSQFIPLLPVLSTSSHPFTTLEFFQSTPSLQIALQTRLQCPCGSFSSTLLPCSHQVCSLCLQLQTCPACSIPISSYSQSLKNSFCLCCKSLRPRQDCPHYCLNCVSYKLQNKNKFVCLICCVLFKKEEIATLKCLCGICGTLGRFGFQLICGCVVGEECFKKAAKEKECKKCAVKMGFGDLLGLQKRFKYRCHYCLTSKSHQKFIVTECCGAKICNKCQKNPNILCCF